MFSCDAKQNFQHLCSSILSHDSWEIILIFCFAAQETFLIIINVAIRCCSLLFNSEQIITFMNQGCIKLIKSDMKGIYMVQNIYVFK